MSQTQETGQTFVIVGASLAGAKAAETLREEGFEGRLVMIGAEAERPYERPPLTKDYLRSESSRQDAYVHPEAFYRDHEIELITGTAVTALDPGRSQVTLEDGRELGYERLLLATGAAPRRLSIPGADLEAVHYLRTLADCDTLRARLTASGGKVAVVGAGWIGAEFAASARQRGAEVTMIDPASVPLERVLGPEVGAVYRDVHRSHGVELLLDTTVESFEGDSTGWAGTKPTTASRTSSPTSTKSAWSTRASRPSGTRSSFAAISQATSSSSSGCSSSVSWQA